MVRELSSSLEAALAASEARVNRLAGEQGKLEEGLQEVRGEGGEVWEAVEGLSEEREGVGRRLSALEERSSTDQMLWRWNTQVCNASIHEVKQRVEEKLALLNVKEEVTVRPPDPTELFTSSRILPTSSSPMDIFKKFESSLLDYQYDYSYGDSVQEEEGLPDPGLLQVAFFTPISFEGVSSTTLLWRPGGKPCGRNQLPTAQSKREVFKFSTTLIVDI